MKYLLLIMIITFTAITKLMSEEKFIAFPDGYDKGSFNYNYGLEISRLPNSIGEDMFQQLPIAAIDMRYGFQKNISLTAKLRTIVLTNSISLGINWTVFSDRLTFAIGNSFLYWYGFADMENMDASAGGYELIPEAAIGYSFEKLFLTIKGETIFSTLLTRQISDISIETSKFKFIGWRGSFIIEQPVYDETYLLLAFKINYTGYQYQNWLAFTTTKHWLIIPEFQVGIKL